MVGLRGAAASHLREAVATTNGEVHQMQFANVQFQVSHFNDITIILFFWISSFLSIIIVIINKTILIFSLPMQEWWSMYCWCGFGRKWPRRL